jgi:hypothetical protein
LLWATASTNIQAFGSENGYWTMRVGGDPR